MKFFFLGFEAVAYFAGFANITLSVLVWLKTGKKSYLYFTAVMTWYLLGIMLANVNYLLEHFWGWGNPNGETIYIILYSFDAFLLYAAASYGLHFVAGIPFRGLRRIAFLTIASIPAILAGTHAVLAGFQSLPAWFEAMEHRARFASIEISAILWSLCFVVYRRRIKEPFFLNILWFALAIFLLIQPLYIADVFSDFRLNNLLLPTFARTLVFVIYNVVSLVLLARLFLGLPDRVPEPESFDLASEGLILTNQEKRVLALLDQGLSNKEIAFQLDIEVATVRSHLQKIYQKTGLSNRVGLRRLSELMNLQNSRYRKPDLPTQE